MFSLVWSFFVFNMSLLLLLRFDACITQFQFVTTWHWLGFLNISFTLGIDGIALFMVLLTTFLIPVCVLLGWRFGVDRSLKIYMIAFFTLESILIGVFTSLDILVFYVLFEAVLIPMFLIVGVYGSRQRKSRAAYLLFLYTLTSSVFMLIAIIYVYVCFGTTDFLTLKTVDFSPFCARFCWLAFFASFAVKMPLVPVHIWLPEAHCEAPTAGSVILAGILLKLGGFGFIRYSLGLFFEASAYFAPLVYTISCFGVVFASLTTMQQVDLKKVIAYSSIGHMGIVTIGIFSLNIPGLMGSILLMLSHGVVSGALFICVGLLYDRYYTRTIKYYSGLMHVMPLFSVCFILLTMGNIGLPGTSSFIGEFLVLVSCLQTNLFVALLSGSGMVLGAGYSLWLCNRILFGNLKQNSLKTFNDLTRLEAYILSPFVILTLVVGLMPETVLRFLNASVTSI